MLELGLGRLVARVLGADRVGDLGGRGHLGDVLLATEADLALVERDDRLLGGFIGAVREDVGGEGVGLERAGRERDGIGGDKRLPLTCLDVPTLLDGVVRVLLRLGHGRNDPDRRERPVVARIRQLIGGSSLEGLPEGLVDRLVNDVVRRFLGTNLLGGVLLLLAEADLALEERHGLLGDGQLGDRLLGRSS